MNLKGKLLIQAKRIVYRTLCGGDFSRYLRLRSWLMRRAVALGIYERRHVRFLRRIVRKGDTVIDVGANFGAYTIPLARAVGAAGRVLAFEPLPVIYEHLRRNTASLPQVRCHDVALSDSAREGVEVRLPLIAGGVPEPSLASLEGTASAAPTVTVRIRTERLDDFLPQLEKVAFIKVDIEGHEPRFLAGARRVIESYRPIIQFEANAMQHELPAYTALADELGYELMTLGASLELEPLAGLPPPGVYNYYLVPKHEPSSAASPRSIRKA